MTAEGMFYVLAFRVPKCAKSLDLLQPAVTEQESVLNFQKIYQRLRKYAKSCESRPKGEKVLENAPKVEKVCQKLIFFC